MPLPGRNDPRIDEELRYHRDRLVEDFMAEGLSRRDAEPRAFHEVGNPQQIAEASALGRTFTLDGLVVTIVGVTPPSFHSAERAFTADVTLPLVHTLTSAQREGMTSRYLRVLARLNPGASVEQASASPRIAPCRTP